MKGGERFVGVILLLLGLAMIYYFGFKGLTTAQMIAQLEKFLGFKVKPPTQPKSTTDGPQPSSSSGVQQL